MIGIELARYCFGAPHLGEGRKPLSILFWDSILDTRPKAVYSWRFRLRGKRPLCLREHFNQITGGVPRHMASEPGWQPKTED